MSGPRRKAIMEVSKSSASTEVLFNTSSRSKVIRRIGFALVFLLFLLLVIACIVLAVLYSQELNKSSTDATSGSQKKYKICDDEKCFQLGLGKVKCSNYL